MPWITNIITAAVITAYCPCKKCCGPTAPNPTASGKWPVEGVTVAGPRNVPFGTYVHVEGVGWRIVQDRTARNYDGRWDVYMTDHDRARQFGRRKVKVMVVTWRP